MKKLLILTRWERNHRIMNRLGIYAGAWVIALLGGFVWAGIAFGEEAKKHELETITVTAQKQGENVQDVPMAISVFDDVFLEDNMIVTLEGIDNFTPGMNIVTYGAAMKIAPSMRGIYSDYSSKSQSVGLYVDGVPILDGTGFGATLMDIERVEVLRGPQGTLYGKNSEVGVINVITKQPDNQLRGRLTTKYGEDDKMQFSATVSGPIVKDNLYFGLSAQHYQKDGFITNTDTGETVDDRKNDYGKATLRWTPTDALDTSLIFSRVQYDDGANTMNVMGAEGDREISSDLDAYNKSDETLTALNLSYDINDRFNLNSITTYRFYNEDSGNDFDYTNQKYFHTFRDSETETIAEEFRLNYTGSRLNMLFGTYLDSTDDDINQRTDQTTSTTYANSELDGQSIGLFAHASWLLTDKWTVLGGLRYDIEDKRYTYESDGIDEDESWTELSPKIAIQYRQDDNTMFFANIAKGYRSGGFNTWAPDEYPMIYDEESLWSYEIGTKISFLDNRISFEGSVYYMDINDMQVDVYVNAYDLYTSNAAEATSMGFEGQVKAKVTDSLELFAGFSYNDCTFDEYNDAVGDYEGNNNPFAPEYDFNIGFKYRNQQGWYASSEVVGYGKTYYDRENKSSRDPYQVVNAKIGYEMDHFDFYVYGKNWHWFS